MTPKDLMDACPNLEVMVVGDTKVPTYYAAPTPHLPGRFDLRQTRYREQRAAGNEHPHDVCAVGFTARGLRVLCRDSNFDADLSALPPPTKDPTA